MKRIIAMASACAVAAGLVALIAASGGGAQTTGTAQTITLYEHSSDSDNAFIDNKPLARKIGKHGPHISRGDEIAFSTALVDAAGASAGRVDVHCSDTVPGNFDKGAIFACAGGLRLHDGTITVQAVTSVSAKVTNIAVTGGTGAYAGARGTITSTTNSDTRSTDVIQLLG